MGGGWGVVGGCSVQRAQPDLQCGGGGGGRDAKVKKRGGGGGEKGAGWVGGGRG